MGTSTTPCANAYIFSKLKEKLPGGVSSPARSHLHVECDPIVVEKGYGASITDSNGKEYIDYCQSWGVHLHGHRPPFVEQAVLAQLQKGWAFGIPSEIELLLAEKILTSYPKHQSIRFMATGTEATMTALRIARGKTKKSGILKFSGNFHGHVDTLLVEAGSQAALMEAKAASSGVPQKAIEESIVLPFNDILALEKFFQSPEADLLAAVILEAVPCNMGVIPPNPIFLKKIEEECKKRSIVFILDEVVTGFRLDKGGATCYFGLNPDLICLGKVIGGGFPVGAVLGKKECMDELSPIGKVFQAGTFAAHPVSMAAGYATLCLAEKENTYQKLEELKNYLLKPLKQEIEKRKLPIQIQSLGSLFCFFFSETPIFSFEEAKKIDRKRFAHFFSFCRSHGIYPPPSPFETWFLSSAHSTKELDKTIEVILEYTKII